MSASLMTGTVLYAEDEESDRMFMEAAFRKAGMAHAFRAVANGQEAMEYLEGKGSYADRTSHPLPELLLLDLNMPLVDGFEVLEWIRKHPELSALPVVVFSSSTKEEDRKKALAMGANEFVEKPPTISGFGRVVEGLMGKLGNAEVA